MAWKPISEFKYPENPEFYDKAEPFIVWNGVRCGEAEAYYTRDFSSDDDDKMIWVWAWTHHSTCSCCHTDMEPQPTHFMELPEPPIQNNREITFGDLELSVRTIRVFGQNTSAKDIPEILSAPANAYPGMTRRMRKELEEVWENIKNQI